MGLVACGSGTVGAPADRHPSAVSDVTVSCAPSWIQTGQTSTCTATVTGTGSFDGNVTWGKSAGTFDGTTGATAVLRMASAGTATVTATSAQDTSKKGTATVTATAAPACGDNVCSSGETCSTCAQDCGACPGPGADCLPAGYVSSGRVFQVGPSRTYKTLDAVQTHLGAGDRVEVDGDATYPATDFVASGAAGSQIFIKGIPVNGKMPVLSGGDNTIHFDLSNHVILQGFEITQGAQRCVFHHADDITICQSVIHDCPRHGILGADNDSGSLLLDHVEVHHTGGQPSGESLKHAVYVATDPEAYPAAVFRIQFSYLHDNNGGNAIKSRALRTEVYYNWIESAGAMLYSLELIGFAVFDQPRQDSDVVGNVLLHTSPYGIRVGGDGTGDSKGRVRFDNNTFLVSGSSWDASQPMIRFFDRIESFELSNNVFYKLGGGAVCLMRNTEGTWVGTSGGSLHVAGANNWIPTGTVYVKDSATVPAGLTGTLTGSAPGYTAATSPASLDLGVVANAPIRQAGAPLVAGPAGFEIDRPLLVPAYQPPPRRPASFTAMGTTPRSDASHPTIGALAGP